MKILLSFSANGLTFVCKLQKSVMNQECVYHSAYTIIFSFTKTFKRQALFSVEQSIIMVAMQLVCLVSGNS